VGWVTWVENFRSHGFWSKFSFQQSKSFLAELKLAIKKLGMVKFRSQYDILVNQLYQLRATSVRN